MPKVFRAFEGTLGVNGRRLFGCCLNTSGPPTSCHQGPRCSALLTKRNRNGPLHPRCANKCVLDFQYCSTHLQHPFFVRNHNHYVLKIIGVKIKQSTIGDGSGLGLFSTRHFQNSNNYMTNVNIRGQVHQIRCDKRIVTMGGNPITQAALDNLYDYDTPGGALVDPTAPYAFSIRRQIINADCIRGAGSYANSIVAPHNIRRRAGPIGNPNGAARQNSRIRERFLVTTCAIYPGEEIFTSYGNNYWGGSGPTHIQHQTVNSSKTRNVDRPVAQLQRGQRTIGGRRKR